MTAGSDGWHEVSMSQQTREVATMSANSTIVDVQTIHRAVEITAREGYSLQEWMWALNLAAGSAPAKLRITARLLNELSKIGSSSRRRTAG